MTADKDIARVKDIVSRAAVYVPFDCEGIRIDYWDTEEDITEDWFPGYFYGTGEESGTVYEISYDDVNLATDMFYELKLIEVDK